MKRIKITSETPLSALIRENHHQRLTSLIEQWCPFLKGDCSDVDVLQLSYFEFDFDRINTGIKWKSVYRQINRYTGLYQ